MGHKTWAAGESLLAVDFQPQVADQIVAVYADAAARLAGWPSPPEGAVSYLRDTDLLYTFSGSSWVSVGLAAAVSATVATGQASSSTTYTDLATVGPVVSLVTGTKVLVTISVAFNVPTANSTAYVAVAVSGATTIAAADANGAGPVSLIVSTANNGVLARTFALAGLTPGTNTFTLKYKLLGAVSTTFLNRDLTITPMA